MLCFPGAQGSSRLSSVRDNTKLPAIEQPYPEHRSPKQAHLTTQRSEPVLSQKQEVCAMRCVDDNCNNVVAFRYSMQSDVQNHHRRCRQMQYIHRYCVCDLRQGMVPLNTNYQIGIRAEFTGNDQLEYVAQMHLSFIDKQVSVLL